MAANMRSDIYYLEPVELTNMTSGIGLKNPAAWDMNHSRYPETDELPLMSSPAPILMILALYLLFILKVGPEYMRKRDPFKLKVALILYNFAQVLLSAYMVHRCLRILLRTGIAPKTCYMTDENIRREFFLDIWLYFAAKVTELLDTVFFVLRKKDNQVTFLHIYHHSIMMSGTWALLKYWPQQSVFFIGFLNSMVHVFMYTYYGLAALGPNVAKYLTWKKYMTKFQLIQFVLIIIHYVISVRRSDCPPAKGVVSFVCLNTFFFLILFLNFYRQSYIKKSNKTKHIEESNEKHLIKMDNCNGKTKKLS